MISIITIVKNDKRIEVLQEKLKIIKKPQKIEIIVIDASEGKLDSIKNKFPKVKWIYFHNKTPKKITIPEQRNLGIKKAKGDIIVFIDSDCIPEEDWLIEITKPLIKNKEFVSTGYTRAEGYMTLDIGKEKYLDRIGNANLAIKREVFERVGHYDENMSVAEDYDLCFRILDNNYKIFFAKKAVVLHPKEGFKKNIKKMFIYGSGAVRLYRKHPNRFKRVNAHILHLIAYSGFILLLPITIIWPFYPLLILIPMIINIKRNPLKELMNLSYGLGVLKEFIFPIKYVSNKK